MIPCGVPHGVIGTAGGSKIVHHYITACTCMHALSSILQDTLSPRDLTWNYLHRVYETGEPCSTKTIEVSVVSKTNHTTVHELHTAQKSKSNGRLQFVAQKGTMAKLCQAVVGAVGC